MGHVAQAREQDIERAIELASLSHWRYLSGEHRAAVLERMASTLEDHCEQLIALIVAEAGRTIPDALSEVREAVDFCRYYALSARRYFPADGPQTLTACGSFLCISPWNFPLAIFTGQIAAALAAGNAVLAKPAEQTPLIAARAVALFYGAGVPADSLHLLPGDGAAIGAKLLADSRLGGVAFTGSTETAQLIARQLAAREGKPVPLIAETGGQNAMIVDSTALPEQVVDDVVASAFLSAGQRCSALRVLYLQEDIADKVLAMLAGAMESLRVGDPAQLDTDIGPVIDQRAMDQLQQHIDRMHNHARLIAKVDIDPQTCARGYFVAPHVFEINSLKQLSREVFGPVLHVIRYRAQDLSAVLDEINHSGYALTLGIHSRIESFAHAVFRNTRVGNNYINRNMVGAVVGVNPFGGNGLSGTGPKAGGPHYLLRFAQVKPADDSGMALPERVAAIDSFVTAYRKTITALPGPTGESNQLSLIARGKTAAVIHKGYTEADIALLIALPLAAGCSLTIYRDEGAAQGVARVLAALPEYSPSIFPISALAENLGDSHLSAVAMLDTAPDTLGIKQRLAARTGAIVPLVALPAGGARYFSASGGNFDGDHCSAIALLMGFLSEKTRTENLVARGGNTQLFTISE